MKTGTIHGPRNPATSHAGAAQENARTSPRLLLCKRPLAIAPIRALKYAGLSSPETVSVVGFDDNSVAATPRLRSPTSASR